MKKVVGIGELLWDLFPAGKQPGGAPGNFAYNVMQLGMEGYAVSAVGKDELGDELVEFLKSKKMNTVLECVDFPTGTVEVSLDQSGIPTYIIHEGVAWDNIPLSSEMVKLAKETDAVCFGTLGMRHSVSNDTISKFIDLVPTSSYKIFDINFRQHYYTKELIDNNLSKSNVLKINEDEIIVLMEMLDKQGADESAFCSYVLKHYKLKLLILTKGSSGSMVFSEDGTISKKDTPKIDVADTVGAGDAFTAAFIVGVLNGKSVSESHEFAIRVSAFVCSQKGAMCDYQKFIDRKTDL